MLHLIKKLVKLKVAFEENKENSYIVGFKHLANRGSFIACNIVGGKEESWMMPEFWAP